MLVVGTAGHIDHGKSSIVRRLTGTDPDRLPEEKARGMTIDLGFAFYPTPDGETVAFVDVPGHERFVKNMVAGVGAIDVVMLVVAADDGWMPQSEEHFQIVKLLQVHHGMIVINKTDLAEPDWLVLLEQEIKEKVKGSFLENAPIFMVSAQTGEGFENLSDYLNQLPGRLRGQKDLGKPRLYIDRSFVRPGIGGVVTGTLRGGTFSVGQTVGVWPSTKEAKIRTLQSNSRDVEIAHPGQRTAVSLTGIDREHLVRGGVITGQQDFAFFRDHPVLALTTEILANVSVTLDDRRRVLIIVGTTEVEGEVRLYKGDKIRPGSSGMIFFKPDEPVYSLIGDRFIMRLPTPMVTLGGGQVLDHLEHFPRKKDIEQYQYLERRQSFSAESYVLSEVLKRELVPLELLGVESVFSMENIKASVKALWQRKLIDMFEGYIYHIERFNTVLGRFRDELAVYFDSQPHLKGLSLEQISDITGMERERAEPMIRYLLADGGIIKIQDKYNVVGRNMSLKGLVKAAHDDIMNRLRAAPFAPPSLLILSGRGKPPKEAIKFILETGEAYKCGADFIFLSEVWEEVIRFIREKISESGELSVGDLKEKFGFSRRFAIPVLEETDRIKFTRRNGDVRVKGERFEDQEFAL